MNRETLLNIFDESNRKRRELLQSKGHDYGNEDTLANFKHVAAAMKALNIDATTPEGVAMLLVLLKMDRINNLIASGKQPKHESIDDTFLDWPNYGTLTEAIVREKIDTLTPTLVHGKDAESACVNSKDFSGKEVTDVLREYWGCIGCDFLGVGNAKRQDHCRGCSHWVHVKPLQEYAWTCHKCERTWHTRGVYTWSFCPSCGRQQVAGQNWPTGSL